MSRWKAAGIHLSISVLIGLIVGALLLFVWYPPPYFHAAGADVLMLLLIGVDIVVGPLLTLIVFRTGKRGLGFDLAVIAIVQLVALVYGLHVVLQSRPVFLVAVVDRFNLVSANELDPKDVAEAPNPAWRSLSWTGPHTVGVALPEGEERNKLLFQSVGGGKDADKMPRYYVDYDKAAPGLLERAKPVDALKPADESERAALAAGIAKTGKKPHDLVWVPVVAREHSIIMLLDRATGAPLRAVAVNPWE
jgi:hypothetical protein